MSGTNTPNCGGRLTPVGWTGRHRRSRVKAIGSEIVARQTGADAPQHDQDHHGERGDAMNMRHAASRHTNVATRRPLKRSSEIILAAVIYLTASCLAIVGTLGFVAAIWVLWGTLGVR
nr:MAG TPA: hypothetical protein [Caudoviricetes sp.]